MFVRAWLAVVVVECDNCSERGHDERLQQQRGLYMSCVVLGTYTIYFYNIICLIYVCQVHCTLLFTAADTVTGNPVSIDTSACQRTG